MEQEELFGLLRSKNIIAILDGDTKYDEYITSEGKQILVSMPYLRGQDLCDISTRFGLPVSYEWGGVNLSRWVYLDNLLEYCIEKKKCSDLLAYLFSKEQYRNRLEGLSKNEIEETYEYLVNTLIDKINGILCFGSNELAIVGSKFIIRKIGSKIEPQVPMIKMIDRQYIKDISNRAMLDVEQQNYDSAITKSRTLLEETFCYVIEKKGVQPKTSGNMAELYKQVKNLYDMHGDAETDRRINMLYSGLEKIVSAISEMRNKDSDAHGVGEKRIELEEHHARLFVNAAMCMADFILEIQNRNI